MPRSITSATWLLPALTLIHATSFSQTPDSEGFGILSDGFAMETRVFEHRVVDPEGDQATYISTASPLWGETDIAINMLEGSEGSVARVEAHPETRSLHIESSGEATTQVFVVWDGVDYDGKNLQASNGLGINLTADGTFNRTTLSVDNQGPPFDMSVFFYSAPDASSSCQFTAEVGVTNVECLFEDLIPGDNPVDMTSIQAFGLVIGVGGGAEGPIDATISDFGFATPIREVPRTGEEVVVYEQNGQRSGNIWPASNYGGEAGEVYNAMVAEHFVLDEAHTIVGVEIDAGLFNGEEPAGPIDVNLALLTNDDGHPGDVIRQHNLLRVERTTPRWYIPLPDGGEDLQAGDYWWSFEAVTAPGVDVGVYGSAEAFGYDAHLLNPGNGFGFGCTEWTPFGECGPNDRSYGINVYGFDYELVDADVGVSVTLNDSTFIVGDTVKVTVDVTNNGSFDSPKTHVQVMLPLVRRLEWAQSQGTCDPWDLDYYEPLICELGLLEPGNTATINVSFLAESTYPYFHGRRMYAEFRPYDFPDFIPANDLAPFGFGIENRITVDKETVTDTVLTGKKVPFTIVVKNRSDRTVEDVFILDEFASKAFSSNPDDNCTMDNLRPNALRCGIGTLGPGEERVHTIALDALSVSGTFANRVEAYGGGEFEDQDEVQVHVADKIEGKGLLSLFGAETPQSAVPKRAFDPIDVYLNDVLLADDITLGQSTAFQPITLTEYPFLLYLVPGDATDRTSAFDTISVELAGVEQGSSSGIVVTVGSDGNSQAVVLEHAQTAASDPTHVDVAVVHAAPALPLIDVELKTQPETTLIAEDFAFGQTSAYAEVETPGVYNLIVTPNGSPGEAEAFRLELDDPGQAYMVVIVPAATSGKLDGIAVYTIDSEGRVVQPAVVTSTENGVSELPKEFALHGNYPNPFNPSTTIRYDVPDAAEVNITVHDALGRIVTTLGTWNRPPGAYEVTWDAQDIPSGVYFVRMKAGTFVETKKVVLLR